MTDESKLIQVGQTYTDREGSRWECIHTTETFAWCKALNTDGAAYVWTREGTPRSLSVPPDKYTIDPAGTPLTVDPKVWEMFPEAKAITRAISGSVEVWESRQPQPGHRIWIGQDGAESVLVNLPDLVAPGTCDWREAIVKRPEGV